MSPHRLHIAHRCTPTQSDQGETTSPSEACATCLELGQARRDVYASLLANRALSRRDAAPATPPASPAASPAPVPVHWRRGGVEKYTSPQRPLRKTVWCAHCGPSRMVVLEQLEDAVPDAGATPAEGQLRSLTLDERTPDAATPTDAPVAPDDTGDDDTDFQDAADVRYERVYRQLRVLWPTLAANQSL